MDYDPREALALDPAEVDGLAKTLGIAVANLARKIDSTLPGSQPHEQAKAERRILLGIQAKVSHMQALQ